MFSEQFEEKLQYETLIFILAIVGFPLCCCAGIGIIPAGIAFILANNELKKCYNTETTYSNQNNIYTGKIIALIVLIINVLYLTYTIYSIYTIGWDELMEQSRIMMEQYENQ